MGAFVTFGASLFIPLLHGVRRYGLEYMLQYAGVKWYLLELTSYVIEVSLYAVCLHSHRMFQFPRDKKSDESFAVPNSRGSGTG